MFVKLEPNKREEFYSKLKGNKKIRQTNESSENNAMEEDAKPQSSTSGFDLTEAEALQIMNMMPSEPVEIHLMVDELQSRMSEEKQEEFLACIQSYSTGTPELAAAASASMDEDDVPKNIMTGGESSHENGKKREAVKREDSTLESGVI